MFATKRLQKICESKPDLIKKHGKPCAEKVTTRLLDLDAAPTLQDAMHIAGRPHPLKADRAGQFALDLHDGKRLVFEPSDDPPPRLDDGGLDLEEITSIRVLEITDYHD